MPSAINQLYRQAMKLPEKARGDLASRLIESLDPEKEEDLEPAWAEEIRRRLRDIDSGKEKLIPWRKARRMILQDK